MDISITLTDAQQKGLDYITNLLNKGKSDADKITPEKYAENVLVAFLDDCVSKRSAVRTQYGLSLYTNAAPSLKAEIDSKLGFADEFPTGNE